jgi:hypothetical protein
MLDEESEVDEVDPRMCSYRLLTSGTMEGRNVGMIYLHGDLGLLCILVCPSVLDV